VPVDDAAGFFGRPRFLAEPLAVAGALGFTAGFFASADPEGRPRFFAGEASLGIGAAATTTAFFLVILQRVVHVFSFLIHQHYFVPDD